VEPASRRWFGRRLNSSGRRWFGDHVKQVTGLQGDFLGHALSVVPIGALHDNAALRRRILVDALLRDLDRLARHRRFFPHRRRRRWTPVLSLDCTGEEGLVCLDVVQSFIELTENKPTSPLLVIAAMELDVLASAAGTPDLVKDAVERLQKYVTHTPSTLTNSPWLPMLLTSEPEDRAAGDWLEAHRKVTPRIPGKVSAWAPVATTTVITLVATGVIAYQYMFSVNDCKDTWTNSLGERVGLSDGKCEFTPVAQDTKGFPDLRQLEGQVRANNDFVDRMKNAADAPRDYRNVVFFAPLTRPTEVVERDAPANALWQLRGAVDAQKRLNDEATADRNMFPIKLLLANSGDLFQDGPDVAAVIAKRPRTGPGSVAAVIGISQSRPEARAAFETLRGIPVIGSSIYGNNMTVGENNFFMVAPSDDLFAEKMVAWATARKYKKVAIVYDDKDTYFSNDLRDSLKAHLPAGEVADEIVLGERSSPSDAPQPITKKLCDDTMNGILPVLTGRADQLWKLFNDGDNEPTCHDNTITMLAGPGVIVDVASGEVNQHSWLNLAYTSLAQTAAESDEATGNDALQATSDAIDHTAPASGNNPNAQGVLYQLSQGFTVNSKTGTVITVTEKDHKDPTSDRIQILETKPNT
jgi:ABC-type branched-subunit amino acid transport system substrate-binding protein